jgi:hypothetical protein
MDVYIPGRNSKDGKNFVNKWFTGASKFLVQIPRGIFRDSRYSIRGTMPGCGSWDTIASLSIARIFSRAPASSSGGSE